MRRTFSPQSSMTSRTQGNNSYRIQSDGSVAGMLLFWRAALVLFGLSSCYFFVLAQQCQCIDEETCIARNGTVSSQSIEESKQQCQGGEVICCRASTEDPPVTFSNYKEPKIAPGGGCGRKRFLSDKDQGNDPLPKIAFYGEVPWMVAILDNNLRLRCGGSLISPNVVLTAAHCLGRDSTVENLFVRAGDYFTNLMNKPIHSQLKSVHEVIYHSDFNEKNIINDIAIIKLKDPMELNAIVDVICTPEEGNEYVENECFLTGFGINKGDDSRQPILKKMKVTYKSQEYCLEVMKTANVSKFYRKSNICLEGNEETYARHGDGGSPMYCPLKEDSSKMVQIGIVSWSVKSRGTYSTALTSIQHYLPWLREKLQNTS